MTTEVYIWLVGNLTPSQTLQPTTVSFRQQENEMDYNCYISNRVAWSCNSNGICHSKFTKSRVSHYPGK